MKLRAEEEALENHRQNPGSQKPDTPSTDDVKIAVRRKGLDLDQN